MEQTIAGEQGESKAADPLTTVTGHSHSAREYPHDTEASRETVETLQPLPLRERGEVIGTAYGVDNLARFYQFRKSRPSDALDLPHIPDVPLATLCQSTSPFDEAE